MSSLDKVQVRNLLVAATATGYGSAYEVVGGEYRTFQAYGATTASTGAATIKIYGSNEDTQSTNALIELGTITLTLGTTVTADGFASNAPWRFVTARVTAISGTGASVTVNVGAC
jgi:hypothetical protein